MTQTERDLVMSYQTAVDKVTELEETLKTAKKAKDACEKNLLDHLETTGAEKTATYEGLGYVTRVKPRLYARCNEENYDR
ncbi:MAG: hypothetical protein B6242_16395 [Anaerolineaceae bacterium 4572_78]|nr:MAG: hypothetical protein B6242_16395 [Anaerolineaceae bacterium 4572_78]